MKIVAVLIMIWTVLGGCDHQTVDVHNIFLDKIKWTQNWKACEYKEPIKGEYLAWEESLPQASGRVLYEFTKDELNSVMVAMKFSRKKDYADDFNLYPDGVIRMVFANGSGLYLPVRCENTAVYWAGYKNHKLAKLFKNLGITRILPQTESHSFMSPILMSPIFPVNRRFGGPPMYYNPLTNN